jgi:hypothetical protein
MWPGGVAAMAGRDARFRAMPSTNLVTDGEHEWQL